MLNKAGLRRRFASSCGMCILLFYWRRRASNGRRLVIKEVAFEDIFNTSNASNSLKAMFLEEYSFDTLNASI